MRAYALRGMGRVGFVGFVNLAVARTRTREFAAEGYYGGGMHRLSFAEGGPRIAVERL